MGPVLCTESFPFSWLPFDLVVTHILANLPTIWDRVRCARVNSYFRQLCQDQAVWAELPDLTPAAVRAAIDRDFIGPHTTSARLLPY